MSRFSKVWFPFESNLEILVTELRTEANRVEPASEVMAIELDSASTPTGVEEGSQALKMPGKAVPAKFHGAKRPPRGLELSTTAPL
jgi:hypothetical protein